MSRVFVARDATLDRLIVVKVLPEYAAASMSAERFKREIAVAAKLQHPHIVPLLSAGSAGELPFYTMPFIAGESLRDRIVQEGELPIDDVVQVLKDVAKALVYAHEHGIVHRDIKPENVMLSGGSAMVMDFGVAKALRASTVADGGRTITKLGVAVGTPAYMSPEQASGNATVDHRADLYAFGCMAYELLCGAPPFAGRSAQALLTAHVTDPPEPIRQRRESVPPALADLVMQCLEKHAADRPKSAAQLLAALERIAVTPAGSRSTDAQPVGARRDANIAWARDPRTLATLATLALVVALAAPLVARAWQQASDGRVAISTITNGLDHEINLDDGVELSPDGSRLAYVGLTGGTRSVWVRSLEDARAVRLQGTDSASRPFWSPDGTRIGYVAGGALHVHTLDTRGDVVLCSPAATGAGGSWGTSDVILFADAVRGTIHAVPASGGACDSVTARHDERIIDHRHPSFLPDGRHFVFGSGSGQTTFLGDLKTREQRVLLPGVAYGRFVPPGYLMYEKNATLFAQRFDTRTLTLDGEAVALLDSVAQNSAGRPQFDAAAGNLVAVVRNRPAPLLLRVSRARLTIDTVPLPPAVGAPTAVAQSHDGRRLAVASFRGLWIHDFAQGSWKKVPAGDSSAPGISYVVWSPRDSMLLYSQRVGREWGLRLFDMRTQRDRVLQSRPAPPGYIPMDWSADGTRILYTESYLANPRILDLTTLRSEAVEKDQAALAFSPDGRWMAYSSRESGRWEIYLRRLGRESIPVQVSRHGGMGPSFHGDELLYAYDGRIMAVRVRLGEKAVPGPESVVLPSIPFAGPWTVSSDGREFIGFYAPEHRSIVLIQNWEKRLEKRP